MYDQDIQKSQPVKMHALRTGVLGDVKWGIANCRAGRWRELSSGWGRLSSRGGVESSWMGGIVKSGGCRGVGNLRWGGCKVVEWGVQIFWARGLQSGWAGIIKLLSRGGFRVDTLVACWCWGCWVVLTVSLTSIHSLANRTVENESSSPDCFDASSPLPPLWTTSLTLPKSRRFRSVFGRWGAHIHFSETPGASGKLGISAYSRDLLTDNTCITSS